VSVFQFLARDPQAEKGRQVRRSFPIAAYVGKNGSGKSLHAIFDTLPTLEKGRPVLSTVRLTDYTDPRPCDGWEYGPATVYGEPPIPCPIVHPHTREHLDDGHLQAHPLYLRFTQWEQLVRFEAGDIIMDEITGIAASGASGLPSAAVNKFPQLRRADVAVRITGLSWSRVNKQLREACQIVTRCRGVLPVPANTDFAQDRIFRPKRISLSATYSCDDLPVDDITQHAFTECRPIRKARLWIPGSVAVGAYDTFAPVDVVGAVNEFGICIACDGSRTRPKCSCPVPSTESADGHPGAEVAASGAVASSAPGGLPPLGGCSGHVAQVGSDSSPSPCDCDTSGNLHHIQGVSA
jgi:hypothetical protein